MDNTILYEIKEVSEEEQKKIIDDIYRYIQEAKVADVFYNGISQKIINDMTERLVDIKNVMKEKVDSYSNIVSYIDEKQNEIKKLLCNHKWMETGFGKISMKSKGSELLQEFKCIDCGEIKYE